MLWELDLYHDQVWYPLHSLWHCVGRAQHTTIHRPMLTVDSFRANPPDPPGRLWCSDVDIWPIVQKCVQPLFGFKEFLFWSIVIYLFVIRGWKKWKHILFGLFVCNLFWSTRKFCLMHSNHLGIYHIVNAEGLLILAENKQRRWACSLEEALRHCFCDFRHWCSRNKIRCSHRRWSVKKLNITDAKGLPSFGKAFNSRIILAFLADPSHFTFLSWVSYSP